jgi:hypothetical protein
MLPAPAASPPKRLVPRAFLERVCRARLAHILAPYTELLSTSFSLSLPALAASSESDRAHVHALHDLVNSDDARVPADLRDTLVAIADVATSTGHEALHRHDVDRCLDDELGDETAAAEAYLAHRALFDKVRAQSAPATIKSFTEYRAASPFDLTADRDVFARAEKHLSAFLVERRGRGDFARFLLSPRLGDETRFDVVYGRLSHTRELVTRKHVLSNVTDRSTERAYGIFNHATFGIALHGHAWMKDAIRTTLGEVACGAREHFVCDEMITLAPLLNLTEALRCDDVDGLSSVELHSVLVGFEDGSSSLHCARADVRMKHVAKYVVDAIAQGRAIKAKLYLILAGPKKKRAKLEIAPPGALDYDRRDPELDRIVRALLVARGYAEPATRMEREVSGEYALGDLRDLGTRAVTRESV